MNYWLVRAKWGVENKKAEFINNDEWINGYDDKYLEIVKRVETEDILLLADDSTITHYGKCIANPKDGQHLTVNEWTLLYTRIPYYKNEDELITKIDDELFITNEVVKSIHSTSFAKEIKIKKIEIENFTVFRKETLDFSNGLNVIIGENGLGKTHLLQLFSVLIDSYHKYYKDNFKSLILSTFKSESLSNLISWSENKSHVTLDLNKFAIKFSIERNNEIEFNISNTPLFKQHVFIPAKEILSFYPGFTSSYEYRENSFSNIYYRLAQQLGSLLLKNIETYPVEYKILLKLEEILEGKIVLENGRFYLFKNNRKTEISLIAEGLRKIGMIAQLLANGSLTKNSILFWDEPETNLNPRLIRKMAEVLMELSRAGMQIFIATHSLFLVKEIEILRKKDDKVKYFGLGFDENKEIRVSQSEDFGNLKDIVILDEELDQADRFQFNYHQPQ